MSDSRVYEGSGSKPQIDAAVEITGFIGDLDGEAESELVSLVEEWVLVTDSMTESERDDMYFSAQHDLSKTTRKLSAEIVGTSIDKLEGDSVAANIIGKLSENDLWLDSLIQGDTSFVLSNKVVEGAVKSIDTSGDKKPRDGDTLLIAAKQALPKNTVETGIKGWNGQRDAIVTHIEDSLNRSLQGVLDYLPSVDDSEFSIDSVKQGLIDASEELEPVGMTGVIEQINMFCSLETYTAADLSTIRDILNSSLEDRSGGDVHPGMVAHYETIDAVRGSLAGTMDMIEVGLNQIEAFSEVGENLDLLINTCSRDSLLNLLVTNLPNQGDGLEMAVALRERIRSVAVLDDVSLIGEMNVFIQGLSGQFTTTSEISNAIASLDLSIISEEIIEDAYIAAVSKLYLSQEEKSEKQKMKAIKEKMSEVLERYRVGLSPEARDIVLANLIGAVNAVKQISPEIVTVDEDFWDAITRRDEQTDSLQLSSAIAGRTAEMMEVAISYLKKEEKIEELSRVIGGNQSVIGVTSLSEQLLTALYAYSDELQIVRYIREKLSGSVDHGLATPKTDNAINLSITEVVDYEGTIDGVEVIARRVRDKGELRKEINEYLPKIAKGASNVSGVLEVIDGIELVDHKGFIPPEDLFDALKGLQAKGALHNDFAPLLNTNPEDIDFKWYMKFLEIYEEGLNSRGVDKRDAFWQTIENLVAPDAKAVGAVLTQVQINAKVFRDSRSIIDGLQIIKDFEGNNPFANYVLHSLSEQNYDVNAIINRVKGNRYTSQDVALIYELVSDISRLAKQFDGLNRGLSDFVVDTDPNTLIFDMVNINIAVQKKEQLEGGSVAEKARISDLYQDLHKEVQEGFPKAEE